MGVISLTMRCPCCDYKGHIHIIQSDSNNLALCDRCFSVIRTIGKQELDENKCCYCERDLGRSNRTREHIMPLSGGGSNHPYNIKNCCFGCNQWRGSKPYIQWTRELEKVMGTGRAPQYHPKHIQNILKNIERLQEFIFNNLNAIMR